jgi:hypothetical protein|tara:strand:- start:569 stop:724 length:156 start_codon:yes stop_codon:yes gene_type:complete
MNWNILWIPVIIIGGLAFMYWKNWNKIKAIHKNSKVTAEAWVNKNLRRGGK